MAGWFLFLLVMSPHQGVTDRDTVVRLGGSTPQLVELYCGGDLFADFGYLFFRKN